ncbi:glycosyltransferase [Virgibacillus sp. LDC1]|uniref:glycosyltransferase n=1 Tax=Paenibacillus sp. 843 TaxID=3341795 RepID=UPI00372ACE33|nr:glycosyltransferase [Virgibacillus sp. LDC1]
MNKGKLPISACIIVKNECEHVEKCIKSILPVVEEIIVVDTGSEDNTKKILEMLNIKFHEFKWNDDFSVARNYSLSLATQPYILVIDADEVLEYQSFNVLSEYISNKSSSPAKVILKNHIDTGCVISEVVRIFPNNKEYSYSGIIHEQLLHLGQEHKQMFFTDLIIHHYGYSSKEIENKKKIDRNIDLLIKQLLSEPDSPYLNYQMAKTFYVNKRYQDAIDYFESTLTLLANVQVLPSYVSTVFLSYGYCLLFQKEFESLDMLINDAIEFYPEYTDLYYLYGVSLIERGAIEKFQEIKEVFEMCYELGEVKSRDFETVEGVGSYRALYNLGVYYEVLGDHNLALEYYSKSATYNFSPALDKINERLV